MTLFQLALRSLTHYWRTNFAVIAGVAIAVSVLAGALVVGESVKASLRDLAVGRLGKTDQLVASTGFFRAALVDEVAQHPRFREAFSGAVGIVAVDGLVSDGTNARRASGVAIYGVDARFFGFHGVAIDGEPLAARQALVSPALARELALGDQAGVIVRLRQPSAIPASTLHGRRDELGRTIRATVRGVLPATRLGEFSLRPQQGEVRAIFLPLERLQRDLDRPGQINAMLVAEKPGAANATPALETALAASKQLADAGLRVRDGKWGREGFSVSAHPVRHPPTPGAKTETPPRPHFQIESDSGLLTDRVVEVARRTIAPPDQSTPVLSYLAETIRIGDRTIPYSVVSGVDLEAMQRLFADVPAFAQPSPLPADPLWLNAWAADRLAAAPGDRVTLVYDLWEDGGGMVSRTTELTVAGILPMQGLGADPSLTPDYPGISDQTSVADWDPSFPVDLSRITPADEQYWDDYRAAPKAFVPYALANRLWASRFGRMTSLRVAGSPAATTAAATASRAAEQQAAALAAALSLADAGFLVQPVRARALEAAAGTTDFGQYFLYFSFFLVIAGLLLTGLFFRVGVEQRLREIGLLEAIGLTPGAVRALFLREGVLLATAGALLGILGALGYAALIMLGLRTWWVGAVGTTALTLRPSATALGIGAVAGLVTAVLVITWMLRLVSRAPVPALLKGTVEAGTRTGTAGRRFGAAGSLVRVVIAGLVTAGLLAAGSSAWMDPTGAFFAAGAAALATGLFALSWWLRRTPGRPTPGAAWRRLTHVGVSNAGARPGRSLLSVSLIAFATFVIVAVGAFRRDDDGSPDDPKSGSGGYTLLAESVAPLMFDPLTPAGREAYGLTSPELQPTLDGIRVDRFRLRPGDDGSCLNLYRPENPRILAPTPAFVERGGRFTFAGSLAETDAERRNPWTLLDRPVEGGAIPAIVDATSLQYVFHKALGDEITIERSAGEPVRLKFVASLSHSLFQSEVVIAEAAFVRLFPQSEGYRVWLVDADPARSEALTTLIEERLSDFGVEVSATAERLRAYQQVENTYLSTFQALGALGLVLGTLGLGAVLVRNILERRREVALLQAVGYRASHVRALIVSETALLVLAGLVLGAGSALLAVQPAIARQGGGVPVLVITGVAVAVALAGIAASMVATAVATRLPILAALKSE